MLRADPIERAVLVLVAERADHWRLELDRRLARLVISEYAAATKRRAS
jgi:hypothetical protein